MQANKIEEINEILEGLHYGQVVEFKYKNQKYCFESYKLKNDNHHSLCLYRFEDGNPVGKLIFANKISYYGETDYPIKFKDNYPIEEIKTILEKEKTFEGKNFFDAYGDIELTFID